MKKFLSLILCLTMIFSLALPCFAVYEEYPTIYVTGAQTNNIYSADNKRIYPWDTDLSAVIKEALKPCLEAFATGFVTQDFEEYADVFYSYLAPVFEEVKLDKNGEASDGSHPEKHSSTVTIDKKQSNYGIWDYRFWYDWRLSPVVTAEELKDYIDAVKIATGKDKVQLVGRCYGANVIQTYLTLYKEHAIENVSDAAYYCSSVMGIDFMSALFAGEVKLEPKAVSNFVDYYMENEGLIEDEATAGLVMTLVELFQQVEVLGLGTEALEYVFNMVKDDLIPRVIRDSVGSWPSYWSMVTPELYEKARDFVFADCKDEYAKFIEKTDAYYYGVQLKVDETLLELQDAGVNILVFTKYGFPAYPLNEGAATQSDADTSVYRQSFGATSADYGEVLSDKYIKSLEDTRYLSPDLKIDASTALLPERSWFVKNLHHNNHAALHDMTLEIMRYDLTVESEKYPQYLYNENDVLTPITGVDEDAAKAPANPLVTLLRFITSLFKVFANLLSKLGLN